MTRIARILVPVDFTDYSNRAVDYAGMLAAEFGARVRVLHVIEKFTYSVTDTIQVVDHYSALQAIAQPLIEGLRKRLDERGVAAEAEIRTGTPYAEILDEAKRFKPDLIVMGTHGRTGLAHALLGSVAERVVRLATCPVLTVRSETSGAAARGQAKRGPRTKPKK
jgi:nucleotide-binding universal stress UspA family protein